MFVAEPQDEITFEREAGRFLADPWAARDDYIQVLLDDYGDGAKEAFLQKHQREELAPEGLAGFIANLSAEGICGFNVTMPYKQALLEYIDFADESARNGVNTVVVKENLLYGYSTDAAGFKKSLHDIGRGYRDKTIVFIGCGAVTKSLVQAAQCSGAKKITLLNRTLSRAAALADGKTIFADSMEAIENHMPCCDLLINTTPIGMQNSGLEFESLDFIELLPESACVCDLIYYPKETKLLSRARRRGLSALNGLTGCPLPARVRGFRPAGNSRRLFRPKNRLWIYSNLRKPWVGG